jgi:hypothetical protein
VYKLAETSDIGVMLDMQCTTKSGEDISERQPMWLNRDHEEMLHHGRYLVTT